MHQSLRLSQQPFADKSKRQAWYIVMKVTLDTQSLYLLLPNVRIRLRLIIIEMFNVLVSNVMGTSSNALIFYYKS